MDLNYSQEESAFRDEVRGWIKQNLPQDLREKIANYEELGRDDLLRWHKILAKKGWVAPSWPKEFGGTDWNVVQRYIFEEECGYAGAPPLVPFGHAVVMESLKSTHESARVRCASEPARRSCEDQCRPYAATAGRLREPDDVGRRESCD